MNDIKAEVRGILAAEKFCEIFDNPKDFDKLNAMTIEDLRELNKMVVEVIKRKREKVGNGIKREIKVGDIIQVKGDKFKGELWEVLKLNPKKAVCKRENGETWNIGYAGIITE